MFVLRELVNLAEITYVANKYIKNEENVENIVHESEWLEYSFQFSDQRTEKKNVRDWVKELRLREAEDIYIGFDMLDGNKLHRLSEYGIPAGLICKYKDGKVTMWHKGLRLNPENRKNIMIYQERIANEGMYNNYFAKNFENNFKYFKGAVKNIKEFAKELECPEWEKYFEGVLELENIEKAKKSPVSERLYRIMSDTNLCVYTMAMQAYPFGGMGSWLDSPEGIAKDLGRYNEFIRVSIDLFNELMGMIVYTTNEVSK